MATARVTNIETKRARRPPAKTPEGREAQLTALAYDLVEKRMLDGTASASETTYFLKTGGTTERMQREKLAQENELLKARVDQLQSQVRSEEMYAAALKAMSIYQGHEEEDVDALL